MHKRGQITTFAILGIVIVAAIILVLYLRGQFFFGPVTPENLAEKISNIEEHITTCITEAGEEPINRIALQGGYLQTPEQSYRKRNDIPISILCYNIPEETTCSNRMLTQQHMEQELATAIDLTLGGCINLQEFARGYDIASTGTRKTTVTIGEDTVTVNVHMPFVASKGDVNIEKKDFTATFTKPLGRLYQVSQDIVNTEASVGEFDQLSYMLAKRGQYIIEKEKPYPDKLYKIQVNNNDYTFQFFIQGEPN